MKRKEEEEEEEEEEEIKKTKRKQFLQSEGSEPGNIKWPRSCKALQIRQIG